MLSVQLDYDHVSEVFTGFGERALPSETVAAGVVDEVHGYLAAQVPVGPYLADQLLLPLALAGGGSFITMAPTEHTRTNIAVIEKFLTVDIALDQLDDKRWRVAVAR